MGKEQFYSRIKRCDLQAHPVSLAIREIWVESRSPRVLKAELFQGDHTGEITRHPHQEPGKKGFADQTKLDVGLDRIGSIRKQTD